MKASIQSSSDTRVLMVSSFSLIHTPNGGIRMAKMTARTNLTSSSISLFPLLCALNALKAFLASFRRLFFSLFDRFLKSSSADFTSGSGSAVAVVAAGWLAGVGSLAIAGKLAADTDDAETDTTNSNDRNWVVIFFILSILVRQI